MIPQHWPSFWLGLVVWPFAFLGLLIVIALLSELSDVLNRFEYDLRQRLAARREQ